MTATTVHRPGFVPGERVLDVRDLEVAYGEVQVVFGVSLHVDKGELVGLVGGNGSGKSTILRVVSGMLRARGGAAEYLSLIHI